MADSHFQTTIAGSVAVEGYGYWSGRDVRVEFRPADIDTGIVFVRADMPGCPRIPARVENRAETPLRTTLRFGSAGVGMVEHIMATLAGLQIDNCEVWTNEAEMPGCDGSSLAFVKAIDSLGIVRQGAIRKRIFVTEPTRVGDDRGWMEAKPAEDDLLTLEYMLDYSCRTKAIGSQTLRLNLTPDVFRTELAPCRTFLLKSEADYLLANGLGQRASYSDLLVFGDSGPIKNELRFEDECVRHKMLDMVGDLALAGCSLVGEFVANRTGHRLNGELVYKMVVNEQGCQMLRHSA